jgi:hypothetical protein
MCIFAIKTWISKAENWAYPNQSNLHSLYCQYSSLSDQALITEIAISKNKLIWLSVISMKSIEKGNYFFCLL